MESKQKPRALIYVRTSGEESEDEHSLDIQVKDCMKFCDYKGYEMLDLGYTIEIQEKDKEPQITKVPGIVDNGYTGANLKRPGIQRVLKMAENKEFDYLIVWKLDRFSRKVLDVLTVLEEFEKWGVKFLSEKEPFLNTDSIYGKFLLQVLAVVAELERENIKLRTQGGRNEAMRAGHWHGSPPYGYDKNENFRLVRNENKIKIVNDLFRWAVYDGYSLNQMAKQLNDRGVKTTKGGKWSGTTIRNILMNPAYIGEAFLRRKQKKELQIPYFTDPIVSKEMFERARVTLSSNRNSLRGQTKHPATYAPYLYCAICGGKMYPQGRVMKKRGLVISYSGNRNNKDKPKSRCANCGWIKQHLLDFAILPQLSKIINTPEFWLNNLEDKKVEDLTPILEIENRALDNLNKIRDRVGEKWDMGFYKTREEFQKALKEADRAVGLKMNDILLIKQRMASQGDKNMVVSAIQGAIVKMGRVDSVEEIMKLVVHKIFIDTKSRRLTIHLRIPMIKPVEGIYPISVQSNDKQKVIDEMLNSVTTENYTKVETAILKKLDKRVVADKSLLGDKSHLYHFIWCPGAKKIKEENKIWFDNEQSAIQTGYKLASNCVR